LYFISSGLRRTEGRVKRRERRERRKRRKRSERDRFWSEQ
jgi:hypothetical protein